MTNVEQILSFLDEIAPMTLKMEFDNVGLLVGDKSKPVSKCLVALDITDDVITEAVEQGAQLIVSHHPVIFGGVKSITVGDLVGRKIIAMINSGISAICMHTNLDIARGGVNDALISALGADAITYLEPAGVPNEGCGRIGEYESEIEFNNFLSLCKEKLGANGLRYHYAGKAVKRIAVMGGSGGSGLMYAVNAGCDTYLTSDVKYNTFLDAKELGINLIDADHFCTENVIIPVLAQQLEHEFSDVNFNVSKAHCQTVQFY